MKRKFEKTLNEWLEDNDRKPLIVSGARQIGKTYLINKFCLEHSKKYIHFDFIKQTDALENANIDDFNTLKETLQIAYNFRFDNPDTIVFFDEIQEAPNLIKNLKYLKLEYPHSKIICSGSLLGVEFRKMKISFPVGYVRPETMYQMDFEEFLYAIGDERFIPIIEDCYNNNKAINEAFHKILIEDYYKYLFLGGMPEVIQNFIDNDKALEKMNILKIKDIVDIYEQDMTKYVYNKTESLRIRRIYDNIIPQLSKGNPKFTFAKLDLKDNRKSDYISAIDWLTSSNIIYKCDQVTKPEYPLKAYEDDSSYKLYMNDTGILNYIAEIKPTDILLDSDYSFKGKLAENYVAQQLKANQLNIFYYSEKNKGNDAMEIDFLLQLNGNIVPIEVKAKDKTQSKSLNSYMDKFKSKYAIRISTKNFGFANNIKSVPLYATFCIK